MALSTGTETPPSVSARPPRSPVIIIAPSLYAIVKEKIRKGKRGRPARQGVERLRAAVGHPLVPLSTYIPAIR